MVALAQDEVVELRKGATAKGFGLSLAVGVLCLGGAVALGAGEKDHFGRFFFSYLFAFSFFLAIAIGALFFVLLQHLTRAGWSVTVRRLAELVCQNFVVLAIAAAPLIATVVSGSGHPFAWADPEKVAHDHLLQIKEPYLNGTFFLVRCLIYFAFWLGASRFYLRLSKAQDESGDVSLSRKAESRSAPSIFLFALTTTFAAVDFLMSLEPHWFSTIIGVYYFSAAAVSFMAVLILLCQYVQKKGALRTAITVEHYHDMGKLLFAFNFFWGYIMFSQYMLIWYANMPEGTMWYLVRQQGDWVSVAVGLLFIHFLIPFVGLMSRWSKRKLQRLTFWCLWLLVAHAFDMYYLVMPTLNSHGEVPSGVVPWHAMDILCLLGIGGIFVAWTLHHLGRGRLLAVKDPRLSEALGFENY